MALQYFLYNTDYNNTLVNRSDNSFTPVPPFNEIYIDYFIPETQPLYLYRVSGSTIIINDQQTINNYINDVVSPIKGSDYVNYFEYTGYTASTVQEFNTNLINLNEYNNTAPSTGDLWYSGNNLTFNNGSKSFKLTPTILSNPNYITVDKNGYGDFTSFATAINSIPTGSTEEYEINFVANTYIETSQIVIPENVRIKFNGSIVYFVGVVDDCILLENLDRILLNGGYLLTSTGHTKALIKILDSNNTLLENMFFLEGNIGLDVEMTTSGNTNLNYLNLVKFFTGMTKGIVSTNTNGLTLIDVENQAQIGLETLNSINITVSGGGYRNNGLVSLNSINSTILFNGISIRDAYDAIHLDSGSTLNGNSVIIENTVRYDIWQKDNNSIVDVTNSKWNQYKLNVVNWNNFNADYDNDTPTERAYHYNKEVHVGTPEYPREFIVGEGGSIGRDTLVYTYNPISGFTDVSHIVATDSTTATTIGFPTNTVDNAVYFSSDIITKDGDYYKFSGLRGGLTYLGAKGTGNYQYEYWNGSDWIQFNRMITNRNSPYQSYGQDLLLYQGDLPNIFQFRFDSSIFDDWTKNDPISSGTNRYWMRVRIISEIDASWELYNVKLHTNRTEINGDGFVEYFGNARPVRKLNLGVNSFSPAINSPNDQNLYYSEGLYAGRVENLFVANKTDSIGYMGFLPYDIDTSSELVLKIKYVVSDSSAGFLKSKLYWGVINGNEDIFFSKQSAPISGITELTSEGLVPISANTQNKVKNFTIDGIKIPDAISQKQDGTTDLIVFTLYRVGDSSEDTYSGSAAILDIGVYYKAWRDGGHINLL